MSGAPAGTGIPASIGPYRIEREIARGGMGIVYLARDTRLDRAVAIKALPEDVAADPERLARFEREAKTLASLNHPNVAGIYGLEMAGGRRYLVLELVEGDTLAARLARGKLPLAETVEICTQIAAGVEAAHESGVIHRDLKPGNVMITPGDHVKVLDFGLAKGKVAESESGPLPHSPTTVDSPTLSSPTLPHSPTLHSPATMPGVILGTAAYLSPEQARGKAVDRRTDIWSFGCVLYECLAGKRVFEGETVSDTIAKILEREVDWRPLPGSTPARIRELLQRCLEKDARKRLRDIGEARLILEAVRGGAPETATTRPAPTTPVGRAREAMRTHGALFAAGLVLGALLGVNMFGSADREQGSGFRGVLRASMAIPADLRPLQILPTSDGRYDVMLARPRVQTGADLSNARIYVRRTDSSGFAPMPGTEGTQAFALSPDGKGLSFLKPISERTPQLRIYKVPLDGSAPAAPVVNWDSSWDGRVVWLASGDFLVLANGRHDLVRISEDGTSVSKPRPIRLPEGTVSVLLSAAPPLPHDRAVFVETTSYEAGAFHQGIGILNLDDATLRLLMRDGANPRTTPTGHLLYTRGDVLYAAPFDAGAGRLRSASVAVLSGLRTNASWGNARFEVTRQGLLESASGASPSTSRRAIVVDARGTVTEWSPDRQAFENTLAAAPDGRRFASLIANANSLYEIWISERGRPSSQRVIAIPGADVGGPIWSRDGAKLSYGLQSGAKSNGIYVVNGDGSGTPQWIVRDPRNAWMMPASWAPDGTRVLCMSLLPQPQLLIASTTMPGGRPADATPLFSGSAQHGGGAFSPDGRWIAYHGDESGRDEVYVTAWAGDRLTGSPLQVSEGGGRWPTWGPSGRRLYYLSPRRNVMSVDLAAAPSLSASRPQVAWNMDSLRIVENLCDILPDGRLLAVQRGPGEDDVPGIDITVNFFDEMKRKIAAAKK